MSAAKEQELRSSSSSTTGSDEKGRISGVDGKVHAEVYNAHVDTSGIDEAKLMRKLDWWLVPWLSFLYLLSFLDRTSIGNAKVRAHSSSPAVSLSSVHASCTG